VDDSQPVSSKQAPSPAVEARVEWMLNVLRAAVHRACRGQSAAQQEDLVQAALVRILERERAGEQNTVRTASYLWRVAFTVTADEMRRRQREERRLPGTEAQTNVWHEPSTAGPEVGAGIRACLSKLLEPRRLAVLLHLQGFGAEEATRILHWNLKRVRNLTYRGLADLRQCLSAQGLAR
jgi:RNA polymerase sigma-70 factor, ECF subfamily